MSDNNSDNSANEAFIINLSNDYKDLIEKKNKEINKLSKRHNKLFKTLVVCYTALRLIDDLIQPDGVVHFDDKLQFIVDNGRSTASQVIHTYLPDENSTDEEL